MARYAFVLLAEKTLDVQYYIWEGDTTGRILLSALIRAADRGVCVRVLLDDMYTARGVRVRILINSFASNDVFVAHVGYASSRRWLVRCGVELAELRPQAGFITRRWTWLRGKSTAGLHTKAAVFDRRAVFIGSFNMDPRSAYLNTALAILVDSPELATAVARFIEEGMELSNAYRVQSDQEGNLVWIAKEQGKVVRSLDEPYLTCWGSLATRVLSLLPIEGQL
jgi:putative cardiolipin synthase